MGLIEGFAAWGWWLGGYLVPFLFVLTISVFFHELGHFMVARLCGVEVTAFSIGFGPEIAGHFTAPLWGGGSPLSPPARWPISCWRWWCSLPR